MNELEEKIYNGVKLTQGELAEAVLEYDSVDEIEGKHNRWTQSVTTILQIKDKLFAINWERGLTECQPNEFYNQPYEVERKTKMIKKTYYVTKQNIIHERNNN